MQIILSQVTKHKRVVRQGDSTKYYGHAAAGSKLIDGIADRLCWSNTLRDSCKFVCENHMKMHVIEEMRPIKRKALYESKYFDTLYKVHICDTGEHSDAAHFQWILDDMKTLCAASPIIMGNDIVAQGIIGPRVGELKDMCHEAQLQGAFNTHDDGIEYLLGIIRGDIYDI